ncbi:MAG TPA: helix-turn-helix domain-containing protein [Kofleriaceae bacterium]|nr:helix-turn-helix domain-containing protein [Kofleriaceae bacterium]
MFGGGNPGTRSAPAAEADPQAADLRPRISRRDEAWRQRIAEALCKTRGNISAAARALRVHRTEVCRLMRYHGLTAERASTPGE